MNRILILLIVTLITQSGMVAQTVTDPSSEPYLTRNQTALAMINFPWQELNYDIVFLPARRGLRALLVSKERRIEVYARPEDNARLVAYDIAHELGHAIDLVYNTAERREKWRTMRGIDTSVPWFGCNRCSDFNTPAGDFAETFALVLLGPGQFAGRIAPPPVSEQVPFLTSFFPNFPTSEAVTAEVHGNEQSAASTASSR
jgi:hypothetical protein